MRSLNDQQSLPPIDMNVATKSKRRGGGTRSKLPMEDENNMMAVSLSQNSLETIPKRKAAIFNRGEGDQVSMILDACDQMQQGNINSTAAASYNASVNGDHIEGFGLGPYHDEIMKLGHMFENGIGIGSSSIVESEEWHTTPTSGCLSVNSISTTDFQGFDWDLQGTVQSHNEWDLYEEQDQVVTGLWGTGIGEINGFHQL